MDFSVAKSAQKRLKQCIEFILQECRMVLPGIQALFGLQLLAVFNEHFSEISITNKYIHLASIIFTITSIVLLIRSAAYQRQNMPNGISPEVREVGTSLVRLGMFTLMISISLDFYLVTIIIPGSFTVSIICGIACFLFLASVWFIHPWISHKIGPSRT
jgi:hypothetical protein